MSSKRDRDLKDKYLKIILAAFAALIVGYYILNYVATWEHPPLGNTFYIILGCIIIAASVIVIAIAIKYRYFPKKRKKKSRPIFLDELPKKKPEDKNGPKKA